MRFIDTSKSVNMSRGESLLRYEGAWTYKETTRLGQMDFDGTFRLQKFNLFTVPVDKMDIEGRKDEKRPSGKLRARNSIRGRIKTTMHRQTMRGLHVKMSAV